MTFDPAPYLIEMGKTKDGKPRFYLQVAHRVLWLRSEHPAWQVRTEPITMSDGFFVFRASIADENGMLIAVGHGTAKEQPGKVWSGRALEKAETAAVGRALAHAGFGTQFAIDDDDEVVDAPITPPSSRADLKFTESQFREWLAGWNEQGVTTETVFLWLNITRGSEWKKTLAEADAVIIAQRELGGAA